MAYQARHLTFVRLYNCVVYAVAAVVYSAILAVLEWRSPGQHVFVPGSPLRDPFMLVSLLSWAVLGVGCASILALYYPSKPRRAGASQRRPEVTPCVLLTLNLSFVLILCGLLASVAAAALVCVGGRDRYRQPGVAVSAARAWFIPIATGALPAVFFALMGLSAARTLVLGVRDAACMARAKPAGPDAPLGRAQEEAVALVMADGWPNRGAVVAALQASGFDVAEARERLENARGEV